MIQPREAARIQCLECGRWFRALPTHFLRSHGMADEDYRLKFGIPAGTPLVCLEWSENHSKKCKDNGSVANITPGVGPKPGFAQRESSRKLQAANYQRLAELGQEANRGVVRNSERLEKIRPYPVTVADVMDRLQVSRRVATEFLANCAETGKLKRIKHGLYREANNV